MGKLAKWVIALAAWGAAMALCVGCSTQPGIVSPPPPDDGGNPNIGPDAGPPDAAPPDAGGPDAGPDAGPPDAGPPDAGPADAGPGDAGTPPDGGTDGGTITFGGPGPWPIANVTYGAADGIQELPVVGVSTDESQDIWVATPVALYLLKPGQTRFTRFDGSAGLHVVGNPQPTCPDSAGTLNPCPYASACVGVDTQGQVCTGAGGISQIVGGGPGEVFVGYVGYHNWDLTDAQGNNIDGTEQDPYRHSGKLDRVRLQANGSLEVVRFDMVSNNTVQFWHNRTVERMIYDHFIHPHELYVGTDHGVDKISPDLWHAPVGWFLSPQNQQSWMSDHLHPLACYHQWCTGDENHDSERMGDWRGLAIAPDGNLWVGGRWAAGQILYTASNAEWWASPRPDGTNAFIHSFGFQYCGTGGQVATWNGSAWVMGACPSAGTPPVFQVPMEGDIVSISAVAVTPDGKSWWASASSDANPSYGIASFDGRRFTYVDPAGQLGMDTNAIQDMVALPDGRLVLATQSSGLTFWNPATGAKQTLWAGQGIPSNQVSRLELDTMVDPPALHVSTAGGAAVLRRLP